MNANLYYQHNMQSCKDAKDFLQIAVEKLNWDTLINDEVMDIGCGPGTNFIKILLDRFPKVQKIIGIDNSKDMIDLAKTISSHSKVEYQVMDIEKDPIPNKWKSKISKIVSAYCLNWVDDQEKAFENIYCLLKPGGEAAVLFCVYSLFWNCLQDFIKKPKWHELVKNLKTGIPESHYKLYGAYHYKQLLESMGFEVLLCKTELGYFTHPSEEYHANFLASICAFTYHIPSDRLQEFTEDLHQECKKCSIDGKTFKYEFIRILFKKPL